MTKAVLAEVRVYRTVDGEFVHEGDPRGAFLAYPQGAEVPPGDQERYHRFMRSDERTTAAVAATDADVRDALRRRVAGDVTAKPRPEEELVLMHDRLVTELADEAQRAANPPADEPDDEPDDGKVRAEWIVYRTAEGDLVHEGDESAAALAYTIGQVIEPDDVDEYQDMGAPGADPVEPEQPSAAGAKRATRSANKAAGKPADK